jgi:hypothetical protein
MTRVPACSACAVQPDGLYWLWGLVRRRWWGLVRRRPLHVGKDAWDKRQEQEIHVQPARRRGLTETIVQRNA